MSEQRKPVVAQDKAAFDRDMPLADLDEAIDALVVSVMDIADVTRPRRPAACGLGPHRDGPGNDAGLGPRVRARGPRR